MAAATTATNAVIDAVIGSSPYLPSMTEDRTYIWLAPIGFIGLIYGIWQIIYLSGIKLDGTGITTRDGGKAIANQGRFRCVDVNKVPPSRVNPSNPNS